MKISDYQKLYRERNKARLSAWRREYYLKNKERQLAYVKERYAKKRDQILAYTKEYREANKEKCYELKKAWRANNPIKRKDQARREQRRKRESVPGYKARCSVSRRMNAMLRGSPLQKSKMLNITAADLRAHLESLFQPGMTWDNYGKTWHVDHIKPCALFDFTDPQQVRDCFQLSNLQPLWATENIRKSDQYPYVPQPVAA